MIQAWSEHGVGAQRPSAVVKRVRGSHANWGLPLLGMGEALSLVENGVSSRGGGR